MKPDPSQSVADFQARLNRSTRRQWDWYTAHRREIESLLLPLGRAPGPTLAVLGAGNCNDLSLPTLIDAFEEVHLVDIDAAALHSAAARQGVAGSPRLFPHGGVDLTGLGAILSRRAAPTELAAACRAALASGPAWDPQRRFDVVLSPCVLSQLIRSAAAVIGDDHADFSELAVGLRRQHLQQMSRLLAPGGRGVLAVDLASSQTLADLARPTQDLSALMRRALATGNFFSALSPTAIWRDLENSTAPACPPATIRQSAPWRWQLGAQRSYLVYALSFQAAKSAADNSSRISHIGKFAENWPK